MKNRMFGDDEPETPSPRTTIVGGRPPEGEAMLPPVPTGLQRLLRLASVDERFREALLDRRSALAAAAGIELVPSERAVLDAAPAEQLAAMAMSLPLPQTDRRTFLQQAAVAALAVLAGSALQGCIASAGNPPRSEKPPPPGPEDGGAERPKRNPITKGIRDDVPLPKPEDGGVERPEETQPTRGIRHDVPPPRPEDGEIDRPDETPLLGGARDDLPPPKPKAD